MKVRDRFDKNRIGDLVCDGAYKYVQNFAVEIDGERVAEYNSLDAVVEEWEDYEEQEGAWYINEDNEPQRVCFGLSIEDIENLEEIGLLFKTKEETEKAIEKLKAWKRLKDKGFRFTGYTDDSGDLFSCQVIRCRFDDFGKESRKDIDLLFGGKE